MIIDNLSNNIDGSSLIIVIVVGVTKPQLNRPEYLSTYMEIYFINRNNMSIILNSKTMIKQALFNLTNDDIHSSFPDDPNVGDVCLFTEDVKSDSNWHLGKILWQDFDFDKLNKSEYSHLTEMKLNMAHYLFTSCNGNYEKITETYEYLHDFCSKNNLQVTGILELFPTSTPKSNDDEIVVDIYFAIGNEIPKKLLKQYQPYQIRRRKYNFFTY